MANSFSELEEAYKHLVVSMYYSCYNNSDIDTRKEVASAVIKSLRFLGENLNYENSRELVEHINYELSNIYSAWREEKNG